MISVERTPQENSRRRRVAERKNRSVDVWAERKPRGNGWIIYAGIRGTEQKTVAGAAQSQETLDYNLRKAQQRFMARRN